MSKKNITVRNKEIRRTIWQRKKKLDCVILGLLSHEKLTGYEIKKRMDNVLHYFWGASYGSIYPTLNGLVKDSFATKQEIKENGRDKIAYTITKKGREHLSTWLVLPVEKDEMRYETLLKLFFGSEIGHEGTLSHISNFKNKIKKELPVLQQTVNMLEQIKDNETAHKYYLLTAMFGVKVYQSYIEWCTEAEILLQKQP